MAKRTKTKQSIHDKKVEQIARKLERQGWKVKADLPEHEKPGKIGKYVPDIEATKPGTRKIFEVETKDSIENDKEQISTFKRSAGQRNRTTFDVIIADE